MIEIKIAPEVVPRLPVADWGTFSRDRIASPSSLLDARHAVLTTSGRAAIALALRVLGIGHGDRVLVPTYHCPTMIAPAAHAGAEPVFYPITATGAPSLDYLARQDLRRVRVFLVAHYFGLPQPMAQVRAFCDAHRIALIEDCAHALFGESDGRPVGTWGDLAIASLTKFFPVPEGGMLTSTTSRLENRLRGRGFGAEAKALVDILEVSARFQRFRGLNVILKPAMRLKNYLRGRSPEGPRTVIVDETSQIDMDASAAEFDAALALSKPSRVATWIVRRASREQLAVRRRRNYEALASGLAGLQGGRVFAQLLPASAVPYVFPLWVDEPRPRYFALKAAGLPVFRWDQLWPGTPFIPGDHGIGWSKHIFQVPCHQDLSKSDLQWMIGQLKSVLAKPTGSLQTESGGGRELREQTR